MIFIQGGKMKIVLFLAVLLSAISMSNSWADESDDDLNYVCNGSEKGASAKLYNQSEDKPTFKSGNWFNIVTESYTKKIELDIPGLDLSDDLECTKHRRSDSPEGKWSYVCGAFSKNQLKSLIDHGYLFDKDNCH
jgi:hypothetical protein